MANKRFIVRHGLDNSGDNSVANTIINVAEPVNNSDAATKYYVDSAVGNGLPSQSGNNGKFLTTNGTTASWSLVPVGGISATGTPSSTTYLRGDGTWATVTSSGGTVTSVGISGNNGIGVTNSPITSSGSISLTLGNITPTSISTGTGSFSGDVAFASSITTPSGSSSPVVIAPDGGGDLHINTDSIRFGYANSNSTLATRGTGDLILTTHEGSAVEGVIRLYDGANGNITITPNGTGNVGIGTASPSNKLDVVGFIRATDGSIIANTSSINSQFVLAQSGTNKWQTYLNTSTGSYNIYDSAGSSDRLTITTSGNIGLGTSSPSQKLDINGNIRLFGTSNNVYLLLRNNHPSIWGARVLCWDYGDGQGINFETSDNTDTWGTRMVVRHNGNVGISTTAPAFKLDVNGTGRFSSNVKIYPQSESYGEGLAFIMPNTTTWGGLRWQRQRGNYDGNWALGYTALDSTDDFVFVAHNGGTLVENILRLTKAGNIGISTNSPAYKLDINGNARTTGRFYSNEWVQFDNYTGIYSPINSAYIYPNPNSYGSWKVEGQRNGWCGLEFATTSNGNVSLMVQPNANTVGFHNNSVGWQFRWNAGTLYCHKGTYGAGTEATVLDSSNYTSYVNYGNPNTRGVYEISNWNQTTYPNAHFLSGEGNIPNSPTGDFHYGIQTSFHRSGNAYRTQLVTSLYSDTNIYVRNARDGDVWTSWKLLLHSGNFSSYAVVAYGTSNDNIDANWGQSFKTFDPVPSGTPPVSSPNIRTINIGDDYNRRTQLAFPWDSDRAFIRRKSGASWTSWVEFLTTSNYTSYTLNRNGDNTTGIMYFTSNKGNGTYLGGQSNYSLQAYSSDGGAAAMSFHRAGLYAVNMGLDPDNVFRIGGWSAGANRLQLNMDNGNLTVPGYMFANYFNQSSANNENAGVGQIIATANDNYLRKVSPSFFKTALGLYSGPAGSGTITISTSAPSGGATNDIWLQW